MAKDMINFYYVRIQWNQHREEVDAQPIPVQANCIFFISISTYNLSLYLWPRCVWSFGHILHVQIVYIVLPRSVKKYLT
jgi:hypothetical protein